MSYAAIGIITLNRYEHLSKSIKTLQENKLADKTHLFIAVDFPPERKYYEGWKRVCDFLDKGILGFKEVTVIKREENYGSIKNKEDLEELIFQKYEYGILADDDNLYSPCYLEYMNACFQYFEHDKRVLSITGYSLPMKVRKKSNIIAVEDYTPWGSGYWADRYWKMKEECTYDKFYEVSKDKKMCKQLYRKNPRSFGKYVEFLEKKQVIRKDSSLSIYLKINKMYQIAPTISLVKNIGCDSSGEHRCPEQWREMVQEQEWSCEKSFSISINDNIFSEKNIKENRMNGRAYWVTYKEDRPVTRRIYMHFYLKSRLGRVYDMLLPIWKKVKGTSGEG